MAITVYTQVRNPDRATPVSIIPSHHPVWVDKAMTRWCDDDDALVRQCDGDLAMTI